jgi:UDP-N-acetylmuramoyl-L-alanyl-D-glutamate--2,6-diaminopimelate ligase
MKLAELLTGLAEVSEQDSKIIFGMEISGLALDSRAVKQGDLFIALSGAKQHGLVHIDEVIALGARAVLFDPVGEGLQYAEKMTAIPAIPVEGLSHIVGGLASRFYSHPSKHLEVIGITGTNGKTSCSQFLGQVLEDCGIIGTLGWGTWGQLDKTINTTPDALTVQQILDTFVKAQKKAVAMEVSSHGLDQGRVNGVQFKGAVYTNISRDHLDYHGNMADYLQAKLKLLRLPVLGFVVVNLDDASRDEIVAAVPRYVTIWGISAKGNKANGTVQTVLADAIQHTASGIEFVVNWDGNYQPIKTSLYGDFNVENLLCVIAVMLAMGHTLPNIAAKLESIRPVAGRMERCGTAANGINVFVDYAHTPDALYRVLASLRQHCQQSLWVVFGCGGNRDVGKRPQMGKIAEQWADKVIVTDDNPRFEDNQEIAKEILSGCNLDKAILIQDRKQAIHHAIANAAKDDCIVIAGKGHETYQEINGVQYPFSDRKVAEDALQKRFALQ